MNAKELNRVLRGRRIVKVKVNRFDDGRRMGTWAHDPSIYLDDGSVIRFSVEETETGEYGVSLIVGRASLDKGA